MKILFSRSGRPQFLMLTLLVGFTSGSEGDFYCFYFLKCEHFLEVLWNEFECVTVHAVNATSSWRKRQRMSLHLGGTAIHLGRMQMQAVKKSIIQRRKNLPSKISVLAGKQSNKRCRRIFNLPRSTLRGEKSGICCSQIGNNIGVEFCNNANQQKGRSPSGNMILVG